VSFLILDTDKQTTQSLRFQLGKMSSRFVEVGNEATLASLRKRNKVQMPEMIFFDQDGDALQVEAINEELKLGNVNASLLIMGTAAKPKFSRYFDGYIRKPIFPKKLKRAVVESFARGQQRRSVVGYVGGAVLPGLLRELSRESPLWKQIFKIDLAEMKAVSASSLGVATPISKFGVIFVAPEQLTPAELNWVKKMYKDPSDTRITLVGIGKDPGKTAPIRNCTDFFVREDADWKTVLERLAWYRMNLFRSEVAIDEAKARIARGHFFLASILLKRIFRHDPWNIKARTLLAEIALKRNALKQAKKLYQEILALNPCLPQPYFKIIEIEQKLSGGSSTDTLELAKKYCPALHQLQSPQLPPKEIR
jgi:hypothetical protein